MLILSFFLLRMKRDEGRQSLVLPWPQDFSLQNMGKKGGKASYRKTSYISYFFLCTLSILLWKKVEQVCKYLPWTPMPCPKLTSAKAHQRTAASSSLHHASRHSLVLSLIPSFSFVSDLSKLRLQEPCNLPSKQGHSREWMGVLLIIILGRPGIYSTRTVTGKPGKYGMSFSHKGVGRLDIQVWALERIKDEGLILVYVSF